MKTTTFITLLLFTYLLVLAQAQNRKTRTSTSSFGTTFGSDTQMGTIDYIAYSILGGPRDASLMSRIANRAVGLLSVLFGSIFTYFKWFRNKKRRDDRIIQFFGKQKINFALEAHKQADQIGEKTAELLIYELNSPKQRVMAVKSSNDTVHFNIDIEVQDAEVESLLIYNLKMKGNDPQGKSYFTGFCSFKNKLLQIRLQQTYQKKQKGNELPHICYFSGRQTTPTDKMITGEWWLQGQQGTSGLYSGSFTFSY